MISHGAFPFIGAVIGWGVALFRPDDDPVLDTAIGAIVGMAMTIGAQLSQSQEAA